MPYSSYLTVLCTTLLLAAPAGAETIARGNTEALMAECQAQREVHIAPMRDTAVETCVDSGRGDQQWCENYYRNMGERRVGNNSRGRFWHLDECEKAVAAEHFFRMNPGKDSFDYTPAGG